MSGGVSFTILASGSRGNAALIFTPTTKLLIDNGLSLKELTKRMAVVGYKPSDLDAVILSHAHGDHASGISTLLSHTVRRGRPVEVHATSLTAARLDFGRIDNPPVRHFCAGNRFMIGDIEVEPFTCPHDCVDPVNFVFSSCGARIGFSTDLGTVPPAMRRLFSGCQVIVLESNHDSDMLQAGPHPEEVKERVSGPMGHLSNDQAADYLSGLPSGREAPQVIVLGHLSEDNNLPSIALWSARRALLMAGCEADLMVASQNEVLEVLNG